MLDGKVDQDARAAARRPTDLLVGFIGGISNQPHDYLAKTEVISNEFKGRPVRAFYNSCGSSTEDLGEVSLGRRGGITRPVLETAVHFKELFEANPNAEIFIVAHSQGCIHLLNILLELSEKDRM